MNFGAIRGALEVLKYRCDEGKPAHLGFSDEDYVTLTGNAPWIGAERVRVRGMLHALCHESAAVIGLPPIELPAEYVAAVFAVYVSPSNLMVACTWMEGQLPSSEDLAHSDEVIPGMERVSGAQLYAMVLMVLGHEVSSISNSLRKKVMERTRNGA